jgi:transposase, IS30 family
MMRQLTKSQRYKLWANYPAKRGKTLAELVGVSPATISRELKRNRKADGTYCPAYAEKLSKERKAKNALKRSPEMEKRISAGLAEQHSPEQILGRCQREGEAMVCVQSIYNYLWQEAQAGGKLYKNLRHARRSHRKKYAKPERRFKVKDKKSIEDRPSEVAEKKRFGDWEVDTIMGKDHQGAILTLTERTCNYILTAKLPQKTAEATAQAISDTLKKSGLPVLTITADNGTEFNHFAQVEKKLKIPMFFAHPYCSWERGANENNNKLLRQYIPKKMDFSQIDDQDLKHYQDLLNNRPRKKLAFESPQEYVLRNVKSQ